MNFAVTSFGDKPHSRWKLDWQSTKFELFCFVIIHTSLVHLKNEDWKGLRWGFQGKFSDSTVDYTCFVFFVFF